MSVRTTEAIARENVQGYLEEIQGYTNPTNDGHLAAWMMARSRAEDLVRDLDTVCKAISNRPYVQPIQVNTPEEDVAMDVLEAEIVDHAHPVVLSPVFETITRQFRAGA